MSRIPTLRTDRLHLSPLRLSDAEANFRYASNPHVSEYMTWTTHASLQDSLSFLDSVENAPPSQFDWGIRIDPESEIIGAMQLSFRSDSEAEIHFCIDEPHWGRGFVTEAAQAILDWSFRAHPLLLRVLSSAVTENRGSTRVMEKAGMTPTASYEEIWEKDGKTRHLSVYELDRETWSGLT